jgi:tetratricopeptide (TPR) repeat protein
MKKRRDRRRLFWVTFMDTQQKANLETLGNELAERLLVFGRNRLLNLGVHAQDVCEVCQQAFCAYLAAQSGWAAYNSQVTVETHFGGFLFNFFKKWRKDFYQLKRITLMPPELLADIMADRAHMEPRTSPIDELMEVLEGVMLERIHPWQLTAFRMYQNDIRKSVIERAVGKDWKAVTAALEKVQREFLRALGAIGDLHERLPEILDEAERRRQHAGDVAGVRRVLDAILAGLRERRNGLRLGEAEFLHRSLNIRCHIALDLQHLRGVKDLLSEMERNAKSIPYGLTRQRCQAAIEHNRGRFNHNTHNYASAIANYQRVTDLGGSARGTLLRDFGSALRALGRFDQAKVILSKAREEWLKCDNLFQAARCESILARVEIDDSQVDQGLNRLAGIESRLPQVTATRSPLMFVQRRVNVLAGLCRAGRGEEAREEARRLHNVILRGRYKRQAFELISTCKLFRPLNPLAKEFATVPIPDVRTGSIHCGETCERGVTIPVLRNR